MRQIIFLMLVLAGCSGVPTIPGIGPYKIDIQQGNYVNQDMVSKLKPGMTRSQVRFILGTPLVVDMFRTNRWDYVYVYEKRGRVTEHRKLTVIFEDDKLARVEGDVVPAGGDKAGGAAAAADKPGPASAAVTTTAGEPAKNPTSKAGPAGTEAPAEKPKEEKPQEEKGFFGRMLDKIGF